MARTKKLTPEQEKEIKLLQANNEMLENTKKEAKLRGTDNAVKRIEIAQQDVIAQIAKIDEDIANETAKNPNKSIENNSVDNIGIIKDEKEEKTVHDMIAQLKKQSRNELSQTVEVKETSKTEIKSSVQETTMPKYNERAFDSIPNDVQYDIIALPSNGECYPSKVGRIPVGYLTAYDENFLTSPNLYVDGLVIDFLLKNKILDKEFDIENMCSGDVDAVILFLRATSYGADFPITVRDPDSNKRFDAVVDLTTFKSKSFNLKGDENGYFSYTLPVSKGEVKFKYLTRKEEKYLETISDIERKNGRVALINNAEHNLRIALNDDFILSDTEKEEYNKIFDKIHKWSERVTDDDTTYFSKLITNRLELQIKSINGNSDINFIHEYIKKMPIKDSFSLRKYITDNEPGIDWSVSIKRPESLGGGSVDTFLNWDDAVFLNISEG